MARFAREGSNVSVGANHATTSARSKRRNEADERERGGNFPPFSLVEQNDAQSVLKLFTREITSDGKWVTISCINVIAWRQPIDASLHCLRGDYRYHSTRSPCGAKAVRDDASGSRDISTDANRGRTRIHGKTASNDAESGLPRSIETNCSSVLATKAQTRSTSQPELPFCVHGSGVDPSIRLYMHNSNFQPRSRSNDMINGAIVSKWNTASK